MRRRKFIQGIIGSATAMWPLSARAQQPDRMRRIGVLMGYAETDPEAKALVSALMQGLQELGWTEGRNLQIDFRWASGDLNWMQTFAKELIELRPAVIIANTTPVTAALQRETRTIPIVFVSIADPIRSGFIASLAHPGGNITGLTNFEASMAGKWLELLKGLAPRIERVALIFNPSTHSGQFFGLIEATGPSLGVKLVQAPVLDAERIESTLASLGGEANVGLMVMPDIFTNVHRALIISLAARYRLPTMYTFRFFVKDGGLMSYGVVLPDLYRRAASYVDRILKGIKPADLPVQQPTKFEFVINQKTAKSLGLSVPDKMLALLTR